MLDDQVTGNKALAISCRSEKSLKKLASTRWVLHAFSGC